MYRKQIEDMEHPKEKFSLQRVYSCRFVECTLRWYLKSFLLTGRCCTPPKADRNEQKLNW